MATDFIDQLRKATFPTERRGGYSTSAVSSYLNELADWLETGGDDQTRAALVQREMERVGERTGTILSATQESADRMRAEAEAEAKQVRSEAEAYASKTRSSADEHARKATETAKRECADVLQSADEQARATIREADARMKKAVEEAAERTRGVEEEIARLVTRRGEITANLEQLVTALRVTIDGPGSQEFDLPEPAARPERSEPPPPRRPAAVLEVVPNPPDDELESEDELEPGPETVAEHRVVEDVASRSRPLEPLEFEPEPTEPMVGEPATGEDETTVQGEVSGEGFAYEDEMDEQERERRRRSAGQGTDPSTDETNLADLL
jgi:cell division septum initiation protein DivIVA